MPFNLDLQYKGLRQLLPLYLHQSRPGIEKTFLFLPRKEVIQPHLPVRLPCYDFTPVTNPALGGCFLTVAHPLRAWSTSMV